MTNHGDDCYFFYYSTCTKGDSCPFRHCEAAMGSEVECSLWQENRCFRKVCMFRHMEIKKNRNVIPCYWEKQPSGCQKPHCAFHHEKPRFFSQSKAVKKDGEEEPAQEELAPSAPNPANPQLRGVIKADTQENVPSPTHPPVVINPVDDEDEDEDDQFSEEGDEKSKMSSPRKLTTGPKDDSLNFNVRTLEEIRLRKALKASLRKAEAAGLTVPPQQNNGSTGEKENMRSIQRPALFTAKNRPEEAGKRRIADRLEQRTPNDDMPVMGELPLKRSLAQRLGGKVDGSEEDPQQPAQWGARPMKDRLGQSVESSSSSSTTPGPTTTPSQPGPPGEIRIKTLEEIRQEKAAKSQASQPSGDTPGDPPKKVTMTFSENLLTKKKNELQKRKVRVVGETVAAQQQQAKDAPDATTTAATAPVAKPSTPPQPSGVVRVKTLEEIRREKAARLGAKAQSPPAQVQSPGRSPDEGGALNKRRILRINKTPSPASAEVKVQKPAEVAEKPKDSASNETVANGKAPVVEKARPDSSSGQVKVKTFEEIMREKQLRKQQEQEQQQEVTQSQPAAPAAQKQPAKLVTSTTAPTPTLTTTPTPSQPAPVTARQLITVKPKVVPAKPAAAPAVHTTEIPAAAASAGPKDVPLSGARKRKAIATPAPATAPVLVPTPAPAPAPTPVPSPLQQSPVPGTTQPDLPGGNAAKKPKTTTAASPAPAPSPAPIPTPVPVQQVPVQQVPVPVTVQSEVTVSSAKRQKTAQASAPATVPTPAPTTAPTPTPAPSSVPQAPVPTTALPDTASETSPLKKSPENKVKPKVNVKPVVKPSSVKPSAHVRPGQKRKAAAGQGSAVAAVKPLSAAAAGQEVPELQEPPCKRSEVCSPSSSGLEASAAQIPLQGPTVSSSALEGNDEPQTVPVFEQSPATAVTSSPGENLMAVPQSPTVLKTPSQTRARKGSTTTATPRSTTTTSAASSTSAVDDFEELINEFDMEDEVVDLDPDKGEDDILLELSEMIGS
ncbi:hypothetical protein ACEWY4_013136 [Coilia grayii]|uniref:C3H1-type domain-containing protein n=1 Tax=Coilia grayii TaxID=363190 RepID=A0ABD1JVW2_9TELE